jgi:hypothetical protein
MGNTLTKILADVFSFRVVTLVSDAIMRMRPIPNSESYGNLQVDSNEK